ncbi:MAG: diguanylate cyclase [Solirubrobacteraceae bacterium]
MATFKRTSGAVVDVRLAPAGLSRLLGTYGTRRAPVLAAAAALFVAACLVLAIVPSSPVTVGLVFVIPVAIIASELGTRAGLITAALSIAFVLTWLTIGPGDDGPAAVLPRSLALVFLAWLIGRTSDRAARTRELLEQVLEATTDSIYVKDLDGRYLLVNSAASELIGRPGEEILGRMNDELLPDVADAIAARDATVLESLAPATYELSGHFGTRSSVLSVTKSPFRDASGAAVGSLGIARDITEQRRLQERFRRAFEDAPIGMAVGDLDGRFLDVNQALCAITGYSRDELCGSSFSAITHPDDLEADYAVMQALVSGEVRSSTDEKRYLRPDGTPVWVSRSVTLVRDADGTPLHFLDQIQDITERRRFESELLHLADHDALTGLFNRRRFEQELDRQVAEVRRYGPRGALLVLDLDQFKQVNDALGHHAGDKLITGVTALLEERLRDSDIVARLGGDEFAVLLPNGGPGEATAVAEDLVRLIREHATVDDGEEGRRITTSVGVAPFEGGETSGEEMLIRADIAMYQAKDAGRDGFAVFAPEAQYLDGTKV